MKAFDAAIVGAGIVGAACAAALAREGLKVVVIDAGAIATGTPAAGMGHIVVMDDSPAQFVLTQFSQQLWHELAKEMPASCEYERCGTIWVAADDVEMAEARRKHELYKSHGIGTEMHMDPHLLNYVERRRGKGPKLVPGFCLAIEPMVALGTPKTKVLADDWTVVSTDGTWSSHWEHSVALTQDGPLVLTAPDGGRAKLAEYGITAAPDPLG